MVTKVRKNFFRNPRIDRKNLLNYKISKNRNFRGLNLKRFVCNEQMTADSGIEMKEFVAAAKKGLNEKKEFEIKGVKFIPQVKIDLEVLDDKNEMNLDKMLNNYLILMNVPREIQLMVAMALQMVEIKQIAIGKEDKTALINNINSANVYGNLNIAAKYEKEIEENLGVIYGHLKDKVEGEDFRVMVNKLDTLFSIRNGRTFKTDWKTEVDRLTKLIEVKKIEPFINSNVLGQNYFIKDSYWRYKNVLNGYMVGELMAVIYMVLQSMEVWVVNIYAGQKKFLIEKLDVLEMFEQFLDIKEKVRAKLILVDVASLAVPNIVL